MPFAATWMDLEIIILSKVSQRKTNTIYDLYVEFKHDTDELMQKTETDSQTQRTDFAAMKEGMEERWIQSLG